MNNDAFSNKKIFLPTHSIFRTRVPRNTNTFWHLLIVGLFLLLSLLLAMLPGAV